MNNRNINKFLPLGILLPTPPVFSFPFGRRQIDSFPMRWSFIFLTATAFGVASCLAFGLWV